MPGLFEVDMPPTVEVLTPEILVWEVMDAGLTVIKL